MKTRVIGENEIDFRCKILLTNMKFISISALTNIIFYIDHLELPKWFMVNNCHLFYQFKSN